MYILHGVPDWGSQVIHMALGALNVPFRFNELDYDAGDLTSATYLALNPFARVPTLETPDGPIFETGAILQYLSERHAALAPAPTDKDRGRFLTWFTFVVNSLHPTAMLMLHPERPGGEAVQRQVADHSNIELRSQFAALEKVAAQGAWWMSPDRPSILSLYVAMLMRWAKAFPMYPEHSIDAGDYPALQAMARGLEDLPSVRAVLTAEGLSGPALSGPPAP